VSGPSGARPHKWGLVDGDEGGTCWSGVSALPNGEGNVGPGDERISRGIIIAHSTYILNAFLV
jgi:hypothetical protein